MINATINSNELSRAIQKVLPAVDNRPLVPATATIMLVCRGNVAGEGAVLHLVSTNIESTLITSLLITCADNWTACVDARLLSDTVKGFANAPVTATLTDTLLTLKSGGSKYKLAVMAATDFPKARKLADTFKEITLPAAVLREALTATLAVSAQALDTGRPFTNGIFVETTNHYLAFVAYSDNRLCAWTLHTDNMHSGDGFSDQVKWPEEPTKFLLSRSSANLLYHSLDSKSSEPVTLQIDGFSVRLADNTWQTRPMEQPFPDWATMMPSAAPVQHLQAERDDVVNALRRLQGYTPTATQLVVFSIDPDDAQFLLLASDAYIGNEGEEVVYGDYHGERMSIGFPASKLLDLLKLYPAGLIRLAFVAGGTGMTITSVADEELPTLTCVIAAMRAMETAV